jgi:4-hydroxy-tetrahydrodipicolinate reductase
VIAVAVAGAAGRMGQTVCEAVEGAGDMELVGRADPALGTSLAEVLGAAEVLVDFTRPETALENALAAVAAGVHVVIGTTGFDPAPLLGAAVGRRDAPRPAAGQRPDRPQLRDRGGPDDALRRAGGPAHAEG